MARKSSGDVAAGLPWCSAAGVIFGNYYLWRQRFPVRYKRAMLLCETIVSNALFQFSHGPIEWGAVYEASRTVFSFPPARSIDKAGPLSFEGWRGLSPSPRSV